MASTTLIDYYKVLASEHRAKAAVTEGVERLNHWSKADQYERLAGMRNLYRKVA